MTACVDDRVGGSGFSWRYVPGPKRPQLPGFSPRCWVVPPGDAGISLPPIMRTDPVAKRSHFRSVSGALLQELLPTTLHESRSGLTSCPKISLVTPRPAAPEIIVGYRGFPGLMGYMVWHVKSCWQPALPALLTGRAIDWSCSGYAEGARLRGWIQR